MERQQWHRGTLIGPAILIVLGSLLLASNLGLVDWTVWQTVLRLWPVALIALGAEILLRRQSGGWSGWSVAGWLLILFVMVGVVGAINYAPVSANLSHGTRLASIATGISTPGSNPGSGATSERVSQPLEGAQKARVELDFGVGDMELAAMSETSGLAEGTLVLREGERVLQDFHVNGDTAYYRLHSEINSLPHGEGSYRGDAWGWDLRLNPQVPTDLKVKCGVGTAKLDLSKLRLAGLQVTSGVSNSTVTLPTTGQFRAEVVGGIGKLTVMIPRGMAARIQVDRGLTSVEVKGNYQHRGDVYVSPGYDTAQDRVDLSIKGGIGKIAVQEYRAE